MRAFSFLISLFFIFQITVSGSGFQLYLLGSRSLAMGQVGTAIPLDASSLFFNPGAAAFEAPQLLIGGTFSVSNTAYLQANPGIGLSFSEPSYLSPFYFYGILRLGENSPLRLGLSINSPFGNGIRWPRDWDGRFISLENRRNSLFIQPTLSYRIGTQFGIGAGLVIARSSLFFKKTILANRIPPTGVNPTASLSSEGTALGVNVGLFYNPHSEWSFGLNYRSAVNYKELQGLASYDVPVSVSSEFPDEAFTTSLPLPAVLTLGTAFRPQQGVLICFEINYTAWHTFDTLAFIFEPGAVQEEDFGSVPNYKNTFTYRLGGEIQLTSKAKLLLGTYYDLSPVQDGFMSPEMPDANRLGATGGLCLEWGNQLEVDLAVMFETTGERTSTFEQKGFAGTYQTQTTAISLGIKYAFSAR